MYRVTLFFAAFAISLGSAAAASPDPKDLAVPPAELSRARELVSRLASEDYNEREDAQENLAKMGRLAIPALVDGLNANPSPEVRSRCLSLIPRASQEDLQVRLTTFLADADGKFEHDLPGWNEFRKVVGSSTPASRSVFVDMLKDPANKALVLAINGSPSELGSLVAARKQEVYYMRFPRTPNATRKEQTVPDVIALMFAESHVSSKYIPRTISNTTIYNVAGLNSAVTDGSEKSAVYKAVIGEWIETRDDAISMYNAMNQATNMGLTKQGNTVAAKLVQFKGGVSTYRMYAAFALARNGAKEHLPALEAVFTDEAAVQNRVVNGMLQMSQMRDMALASAIIITGQKAEDYGLEEMYKNQPGMQFTYTNWRLPEDKRKEAFEKWKAWREKNPDFGKPGEKK